jgi:two-component system response regulator YesN
MILLIVEDERITREGLVKSIDWDEIGISKVAQAENGEEGLFMAKRVMPDIVLTDIRMPRMDGITMAGHIREILPECRIIFLSAYSEIDYYKAAIDLKAIHYLDKPIDSGRLRAVVSEAVAECRQHRIYKSNHELRHMQERQKLADAVCSGEGEEILEEYYKAPGPGLDFKTRDFCTAFIIRFRIDFEDEMQKTLLDLAAMLSGALIYPNIFTLRSENRIVLLLFTPSEISLNHLKLTGKKLQEALGSYEFYIAAGKAARGLKNANKSYVSAKSVLEKAYLYPWGQALFSGGNEESGAGISSSSLSSPSAYDEEKSRIIASLSEGHEQDAIGACAGLYDRLKERKDLVYSAARELYFEIISEVFHKADYLHLRIREEEAGEAISWIVRIGNYNLDELHEFLLKQISLLYAVLDENRHEKKQILAIKDYIAKNYTNASFSISDISVFLHMSVSHVCTMFKKETGDTINNYLTEYRLAKARQYLRETLFTAAEISAKVGYKDSSYFGRIFRKRFGVTPSEYRNQ